MKNCREIRREAREMVRGRKFFLLAVIFVILQSIGAVVSQLLGHFHREQGISSVGDYMARRAEALQQGLDYSLSSSADMLRMVEAASLEAFIGYVFGAIAIFGFTAVLIKALRRDERSWFAESLGGFRRPLGVAWLMFVMNLRVILWSLLLFFPGIIALYRYRLAWYLKCEHPEWGASRCISESSRLMRGYKWRAMALDFSYFGWFLLLIALAPLLLCTASSPEAENVSVAVGAFGFLASIGLGMLLLFVVIYYFAGRTVFYREVLLSQSP